MRNVIDKLIVLVRHALESLPAEKDKLRSLKPLKEEILRFPSDAEIARNKKLEESMVKVFEAKPRNVVQKLIGGNTNKDCFTYVLLDSGVIGEIQWEDATQQEKWSPFVRSIFYVGKGHNLRPYDHLAIAYDILTTDKDAGRKVGNAGKKMQRILQIWSKGDGVIIVKAFGFIRSKEAQTREAVIIETLGVSSLCNKNRSTYYDGGVLKNLDSDQKSSFGKYLLLQMMRELNTDVIPITPYML